jgi:hypothetical protein
MNDEKEIDEGWTQDDVENIADSVITLGEQVHVLQNRNAICIEKILKMSKTIAELTKAMLQIKIELHDLAKRAIWKS